MTLLGLLLRARLDYIGRVALRDVDLLLFVRADDLDPFLTQNVVQWDMNGVRRSSRDFYAV